jgi:hypothetical protein
LWVAEATHAMSALDGDQPEDLAAGPRALAVGMALLCTRGLASARGESPEDHVGCTTRGRCTKRMGESEPKN